MAFDISMIKDVYSAMAERIEATNMVKYGCKVASQSEVVKAKMTKFTSNSEWKVKIRSRLVGILKREMWFLINDKASKC